MKTAYIVKGYRTAVAKSKRGGFRFKRADELAADPDLEAYAGKGVEDCDACSDEWLLLFGDEVLESKFQDGHYAYTVVAGGGSGNDVFPPVLYVVDVENAVDFNSVLEP